MSGSTPIIPSANVLATIAVVFVGFIVVWSNPRRLVNRAFATLSLHVSIWLLSLRFTFVVYPGSELGLMWLRITCLVGGLIPLHLSIFEQCIADRLGREIRTWWARNYLWVIASVIISFVPVTDFFIPSHSTADKRIYGLGYPGFIIGLFGLFALLIRDSLRDLKSLIGGKRVELQVCLSAGCIIGFIVISLMALNALTHNPKYVGIQPITILLLYTAIAFAMTTSRIFDARQLILVAAEKLILVASISAAAYALNLSIEFLLPQPFDLFITTALCLWLSILLNNWLNQKFKFFPEATKARQAVFSAARTETRAGNLELVFTSILKGWGQSETVIILPAANNGFKGPNFTLIIESKVFNLLSQMRWVTPERLSRERETTERLTLSSILRQNDLGVLVLEVGQSFPILVGVGVPASRRPFTYPQVTQLIELASIMQTSFERAHFSEKAQQSERLATVGLLGASVAHEIRNPLVSIKTFVQHLPQHYHDPVFREKFFKLIGSEVSRIDQLTEQLLDLASPRPYLSNFVGINAIIKGTLQLASAKASDKSVSFTVEFGALSDVVFTDADAARQVLLNLLFNAIQAIESHVGERWIKVSTQSLRDHVEVSIEDSGPGISDDIRARLFQPFQTTKSSGFGLGLAISRNIMAGLNASLSVDPHKIGKGAVFRIEFPCQALSS